MKKAKIEKTTNKVAISTKKVLLKDTKTGEVEDFGYAELHAEKAVRNKNFAMLWLGVRDTGILAVDLLLWLFSVSSQNVVMVSAQWLAKKFDVTRQTICLYLRRFEAAQLLKWSPGVIFLNPDFYWRGSVYARERARARYAAFQEQPAEE